LAWRSAGLLASFLVLGRAVIVIVIVIVIAVSVIVPVVPARVEVAIHRMEPPVGWTVSPGQGHGCRRS